MILNQNDNNAANVIIIIIMDTLKLVTMHEKTQK